MGQGLVRRAAGCADSPGCGPPASVSTARLLQPATLRSLPCASACTGWRRTLSAAAAHAAAPRRACAQESLPTRACTHLKLPSRAHVTYLSTWCTYRTRSTWSRWYALSSLRSRKSCRRPRATVVVATRGGEGCGPGDGAQALERGAPPTALGAHPRCGAKSWRAAVHANCWPRADVLCACMQGAARGSRLPRRGRASAAPPPPLYPPAARTCGNSRQVSVAPSPAACCAFSRNM